MAHDTLSDLLRSVRLRGALFFHVDCASPFVSEAPQASTIGPAILPGSEHVMEYHVVTRGSCWAGVLGEPPVQMQQGDVVVFPHGDAHVISSAPGMRAEPALDFLFQPRAEQLPFMLQQGTLDPATACSASEPAVAETSVLCGFLGCDRRPFNPLLSSLPRMIQVTSAELRSDADDSILHFSRIAAAESEHKRPGGEAVLERLSELMFVDILRRYLKRLPEEQSGWLSGLRDRHVGRALSLMHDQPAHAWTMDQLSNRVGLSRSALHERFLRYIGVAPMQYLTNWRMQRASRLLTQGSSTLASVACESGYESEAAFSRAFKRAVGVSPSIWRRQNSDAAER